MASAAQVLANGRNSRLARGAVTARGRMISAQNARKHGLRAATETVLREAGIAYEVRKQKWLKELNPRTDREEFLARQQVVTSLMVERVHAAHIEQITSEIEGVDDRRAENVHQLGRRLYFNRGGSAALFGCAPFFRQKMPRTSAGGLAVDPDDPAMLVAALEDSADGCAWLAGQWQALRERLEGRNFWQSIDRFRAVRLLAAQPTDAGFDRVIAEIFIASHGIEPPRKRLDYGADPEPAANRAFTDLKSDFSQDELTLFVEGVKARWPDMVSSKERDLCREILVNLADTQIQRLTELLELREQNTEHEAQRTVTRLGFDRSRDAELMRRCELRYRSALDRAIVTYEKVHGKDKDDNEDPPGRGPDFRSPIPAFGLRGERRGTPAAPASACASDIGGSALGDDIQWAREIDAADLLACGGYLPERCLDGLTGDGGPSPDECDASVAGALDEQIAAARGSGENTEAGGDGVTSREPWPTSPEATTDGGLDKAVTNEPNLAENVSLSQRNGGFTVTTNSGVGAALDNPEDEPNYRSSGSDRRNGSGCGDPVQHCANQPVTKTARTNPRSELRERTRDQHCANEPEKVSAAISTGRGESRTFIGMIGLIGPIGSIGQRGNRPARGGCGAAPKTARTNPSRDRRRYRGAGFDAGSRRREPGLVERLTTDAAFRYTVPAWSANCVCRSRRTAYGCLRRGSRGVFAGRFLKRHGARGVPTHGPDNFQGLDEALILNRLALAFRAFWRVLTDLDFAARVEPLFSKAPTGPDLRVLAVLQRDGRLVDFLEEEIDAYSDAQVGAAVRDIHRSCRKSLHDYLTISRVIEAGEEERVTIPADFDPAEIRLVGNVTGTPPFEGVLKHHGWRVKSVHLPVLPVARDDSSVLSPAEVEIP
jgi:Domain of unknown function (DUF2760)